MKLFSNWTRKLSVGMALVAFSSQASGQGESYPIQMPTEGFQVPTDFPQEMMGAGGACDELYEGYGPGCDDNESGMCQGLLAFGQHSRGLFGSRLNHGCGPLGCDGGTFGDGRSLSELCSSLCGRLCSHRCICGPYGEGGVASQRWFDFSAEAMALSRTDGAGSRSFSSQGRAPDSPDDFVLSTDQVELDEYRLGLVLQGNIQVGPGSNVEVVYFGLNKWSESATVSSSNMTPTLYSFFSDFGTNPFDGFDDPDRSFTHSISYESSLNNGEVNLRRRWAEPSGFFQGSFLAGIRYFQLDEQFAFEARGENNDTAAANGPRFFRYDTATKNQLTGFQIGSDLWLNVIPGIKVGTELKGGVFGNHATQNTQIVANSLPTFNIPSIEERASDGRTAYLVQFSGQAIYRLTYACTLRGSYQLIYVDNVALGPENVNDEPPALFLPNSTRTVHVSNDGEIFYTGVTAGVEYTW